MTWPSVKSTGLRESQKLCSHSVAKLHEVTQMSAMTDYTRDMFSKKSCKCAIMNRFSMCFSLRSFCALLFVNFCFALC